MFIYMSCDQKAHLFSFTEDNPEERKDLLDARGDVSTGKDRSKPSSINRAILLKKKKEKRRKAKQNSKSFM